MLFLCHTALFSFPLETEVKRSSLLFMLDRDFGQEISKWPGINLFLLSYLLVCTIYNCFTVTSSCQAAVSHLVNQCNSCWLFRGDSHYQKVDYYPSTKSQLWITDLIIPFSSCNSEGHDNAVELLNSTNSNYFICNITVEPDQGVCVLIIISFCYRNLCRILPWWSAHIRRETN